MFWTERGLDPGPRAATLILKTTDRVSVKPGKL
jgi:hypothetical protein